EGNRRNTTRCLSDVLFREREQALGETGWLGEHRPVAGRQLKQPPLGAGHLTEPGMPAGDERAYLLQWEATRDQRLWQGRARRVGESERLGVGAERLIDGARAHQPPLGLVEAG